jgi:hypothetical protein
LGVPKPGPTNDAPYAPQAIVQGGVVVALYPPDSVRLKKERVTEAEQYNLSKAVPGRINSIVNIHNPSVEVHTVEGGLNTGAAVILAAGGGHNTLNVGSESADFVPYFYKPQYSVRHLAGPFHGLVPGPGFSSKTGGGNQSGPRYGRVRQPTQWQIRNPKPEIRPAATARQRGENKSKIQMSKGSKQELERRLRHQC